MAPDVPSLFAVAMATSRGCGSTPLFELAVGGADIRSAPRLGIVQAEKVASRSCAEYLQAELCALLGLARTRYDSERDVIGNGAQGPHRLEHPSAAIHGSRHGAHITERPFVKLNVSAEQNAAAFRYQAW